MTAFYPTAAQFLQAFAEVRRPGWPSSLDELAPETLRFRLVRLRAALIAHGRCIDRSVPAPPPEAPRRQRRPGSTALPVPLDRKRLASGERDDEDADL